MEVSGENSTRLMFVEFCELCEKINQAKREKKTELLKKYITSYRRKYVSTETK